MKKKIIIIFILLFTINVVYSSDLENGLVSYYDFDSDTTDIHGTSDFNNTGAVATSNGALNGAYNYSGSGTYMLRNTLPSSTKTVSFWINADVIGNYMMTQYNGKSQVYFDGTSHLLYYSPHTGNQMKSSSTSWNTQQWYHFVIVINGTSSKFYVDGSEMAYATNDMDAADTGFELGGTNGFYLGSYSTGGINYKGRIDELGIWNIALDSSQVQELYNSGTPLSYSSFNSTPPITLGNFTIWANNYETLNAISIFNASIVGDNNYNTSSGLIVTDIDSTNTSLFNITVVADKYFSQTVYDYNVSQNLTINLTPYMKVMMIDSWDNSIISNFNITWNGTTYLPQSNIVYLPIRSGNINFTVNSETYFTQTYEEINSSIDYNGTMYMSDIELNVYEKFTGNQILNFSLQTKVGNFTTTSGSLIIKPNNISDVWNLTSSGYYELKNQQQIITAKLNTTYNLSEMFTNKILINATSLVDGSKILNFTANATDIDNGYTEELSTITGEIIFNVTNGNWSINIMPNGYEYDSINIYTTAQQENYTFNLYTSNSVYFTFYDELTNDLINFTKIEMEFISNIFSYNYTTTNGTLYVDLLSPNNYTLRYRDNASIYYEDFYYFNLQNNTFTNLTIYMLNRSVYTNATATVVDEVLNNVEGAFIKVLKYQQLDNTYKLIEIVETNFEGKANLHLTLNDEYYKFIIEYNGETKKTTNPSYVFSNDLTFQISLEDSIASSYFSTLNVDQTLTYNNNTNNFVYTYNDNNNVLSQACMYVYTMIGATRTLYNSTCSSSVSGTILINAPEVNGTTYKADTYITFDSDPIFTQSLYKSFAQTLNAGSLGALMVVLLTIVFVGMGIWNISVALVLAPMSMILASLIGLWDVGLTVGITFEILGLLLALYLSKTQGV